MGRYPTDSRGLARPIQDVGYEPMPFIRRVTNRHHLAFNRVDYMHSPLHRVFRGLSSRVVDMRMADHVDLHERFSPPKFPTDVQMIDCIEEVLATQGIIECVRDKNTHEAYWIEADAWNYIKQLYRSPNE